MACVNSDKDFYYQNFSLVSNKILASSTDYCAKRFIKDKVEM